MDQARPSHALSAHPTVRSRFPQIGRPVPLMNPIRRRPCADPGQKQVPGEWMTQKGIDSSRPVTEAACAVVESTRVSHHGHAGNVRHSPRNGFNGFLRALPGDRAFLPPSSLRSLLLKNLMPASGHQDHTTSPSASAPFVKSASASTASRPAFVTIASRPSVGRDANLIFLFLPGRQAKFGKSEIGAGRRWYAMAAPAPADTGIRREKYARAGVAAPPHRGTACYLFLFTGLRFSMNAAMPSARSSSAKVE
jgi:hypothetical protein